MMVSKVFRAPQQDTSARMSIRQVHERPSTMMIYRCQLEGLAAVATAKSLTRLA